MTHAQKPSIDSEMHELNAEADFLDQKTTVATAGANGEDAKLQSDPDAQAMVIDSLRSQVQDLFAQVSQLNNKLVRSYDRVSDLEDELHVTSSNLRQSTLKVGQLELERTQHLSALSTGLLVEKSHVTAELTRLMEKATEEAARRGQAETARAEIEKDLDDLSAGLFDQANRMVAEARIAEARSARKVEETEAALRSAEEVVSALQAQMQTLQSQQEQADRRVEEMRVRMGKGKWVDHGLVDASSTQRRLFASHVPYHEFLIFVSHLRAIRPASPQPPPMSTLTPLPFLARLIAEDSDPTVRLDLAPSLNWLSRRSVIGAIHTGQLTIEPMQFATLLEELAPPNIPASSHHTHIVCALCGMSIYSSAGDASPTTPTTPVPSRSGSQSASWSTTLFKNVRSSDPHHRHTASFGSTPPAPPAQVYIFRLDSTSSGLPVSLPQSGSPARPSIYPLCTTGWCLARLRTTCSMWAFVRTSVVEKIWEEPPLIPQATNGLPKPGVNGIDSNHDSKATPVETPPRRPRMGSALGSLWGSMQRSLSGTSGPAKSPDGPNSKVPEPAKEKPKLPPRDPARKTLPPPPPTHPSVPHSHSPGNSISQGPGRRVPPPLQEKEEAPTVAPAHPPPPPPLPKRNRERTMGTAPDPNSDGKPAADGPPPEAPAIQQPETLSEEPAPPAEQPEATAEEPVQAEAEADAGDNKAPPKPALAIPQGSISQSTSMDSFSTPTEELQVDTAVPEAFVPLPHSSEPSPKTPTKELHHAPAVEAPATPSLSASNSSLPDGKLQPPSRTGSPAPPPLPRRAAGRARPSSTFVQQGGEQPKRDSVDVPAAAGAETAPATEASAVSEEPAHAEQKAEEAKEALTGSSSDPAEPVAIVDPATPVTAEPESLPSSGEHTAAPTPEPEDCEQQLETVIESSTPAEEKVVLVNGNSHADADADAASAHSHSESGSASDVPPPAYAAGEVRVNGHEKLKEAAASAASAEEPASGLYVGEGTWEERTYRELVRLREEMGWARIGAVVH